MERFLRALHGGDPLFLYQPYSCEGTEGPEPERREKTDFTYDQKQSEHFNKKKRKGNSRKKHDFTLSFLQKRPDWMKDIRLSLSGILCVKVVILFEIATL